MPSKIKWHTCIEKRESNQLKQDSADMAKVMQEANDKREEELHLLRAENKKAAIDQALLVSDFQLFKRKHAAPSGAEELAQCQKDLRDAQIRSLLKDDEIQALELHIHMLRGLMQTHGMILLHPRLQRVLRLLHLRQKTCLRGATLMHHLLLSLTTTAGEHPLLLLLKRAIMAFPMKAWNHLHMESMGKSLIKRGSRAKATRDYEARRVTLLTPKESKEETRMKMASVDREVKQKTWNADGKTTAENWSKSLVIRTYMRNQTLEQAKTLLDTFKQTDIDFQHNLKSVPIESWHETIDDNLLYLHKALGMPINLTVLPHFYHQAAQWPCNNAINMLANTELLDKSHGAAKWLDLFQHGIASTSIPVNISQLGDHKIRDDYRIAKHDLELQTQVSQPYQLRRHHFYLVAIIHNDKRPTHTFLDNNTHIQMKRNYHLSKNKEANLFFNRLFDAAFKNHFNNIMQEIERFATYNTPLEYTLNFTADIQNLYYYTDNCTGVRDER
jgi:hypothetical protein